MYESFIMTTIAVLIIIVVFSITNAGNLKIIPERANVGFVNDKYVTDVKLYVRRYVRRGNYYLNLIGTNKHTWGNNVSLHFVFYEYLHNEYKRSFVEFQYKMCDLMTKEKYIGKALLATGLQCPMPPRKWALVNISLPVHDYPNVWPFEKCRLDVRLETLPEKEHIGDLQMYLHLKQPVGK